MTKFIMSTSLWAGIAMLTGVLASTPDSWSASPFPLPGGPTLVTAPVTSFVELRYRNMVRQSYDISCGAAALATIFDYFYDETFTEQSVMEDMMKLGDSDKIQKEGFSLLEMKRYAEQLGYVSNGYRLDDVRRLTRLEIPVIGLVNIRGYNHFVVIKAVVGDKVYLADPAFGNSARPVEGFGEVWNGVILVVLHPTKEGSSAFSLDARPAGQMTQVIPILERFARPLSRAPGEF